jgi:predicted O-methyltransferase YrrM
MVETLPARLSYVSAPRNDKNSSALALDASSLAFADDFVPASEAIKGAREQAVLMGAPQLSNGACSALTLLARAIGAKAIVEVGSSTGASGLAFFDGMGDTGILTSIDPQSQWQLEARSAFLAQKIPTRRFRLIPGLPLDVLNNLRDGAYDIVFINGDKLEYVEYFAQAQRLLRPGGLICINDALWRNKIADPDNEDDETVIIREALQSITETDSLTTALLPVGDGLLVAVKG